MHTSEYLHKMPRDCIGDCCVAGDNRWGGTFGVSMDLVAISHCAVKVIQLDAIEVYIGSETYLHMQFFLVLCYNMRFEVIDEIILCGK